MNISRRSLKYYEELGVLVPAYIDPITGYRYYVQEQFVIAYLITYAIEVGITLTKFKEFIIDNITIDRKAFTKCAIETTQTRIDRLNNEMEYLQNLYEELDETSHDDITKTSSKYYDERYFLTCDYPLPYNKVSPMVTHKYITKLNKQARELKANTSPMEGFLFCNNDKKSFKVIREIPHYIENIENLIIVPKGTYYHENIGDIRISDRYVEIVNSDFEYLVVKKKYNFNHKMSAVTFETQKI